MKQMNRGISILWVCSIGAILLLSVNACNRYSEFNVNRFGAHGDGETLDTEAIQSAINACSESGGGTVIFPPGTLSLRNLDIAGSCEPAPA